MKGRTVFTAAVLLTSSVAAVAAPCGGGPGPADLRAAVLPQQKLETVHLNVPKMWCGGCVIATRGALQRLEGVKKVDVSLKERSAVVTYDPEKVTTARMLQAVQKAGFEATVAG